MKVFYCILSVVLSMSFMSGCAQVNRDNLRYSSIYRGTEVYKITGKDSQEAAKEHSEKAIAIYKEYIKASRGGNVDEKYSDIKKRIETKLNILQQSCRSNSEICNKLVEIKKRIEEIDSEFNSASNERDDRLMSLARLKLALLEPEIKALEEATQKVRPVTKQYLGEAKEKLASSSTSNYPTRPSEIEIIWPKDVIKDAINSDKANEELIRALSSTASVAQMRDLLTEPSFPPLLPLERTINLGCLPPPDSAAFEAVSKISANLKYQGIEAGVTGEFASSVVKLFEESERTLFLQYALFRLCEMSINSPAEFRNVYPVIIHDIVRRTAEMTQLANQKAEERRLEEEKTKQLRLQVEIQKTKPDKESLYQQCIKTKLFSGLSDNEKIISECKKLIESK